MIILSDSWGPKLVAQGESGMGYQIASILLKDGRQFDRVVIVGRNITQIKDVEGIPFTEKEIEKIIVTHDKWDFAADRRS